MEQIRKYSCEVKDVNRSKGIVTVYANAFNNLDADQDMSMPGSFKKTIKENFNRVKWFLNHDRTKLLGVPVEAKEDHFGLLVTGQLNMQKDIAKDILEDYILYSENGKTLEHSIGVSAIKYETLQNDAVPREYRKNGITWMRQVTEWKWWEYSTLTSWGSNENTPMVSIKNLRDIDSTIQWLSKMLKHDYTDERLKKVEDTIDTLNSLKNGTFDFTHDEPKSPEVEPSIVDKFINNLTCLK